jgi:hypothetical protein
LGIKVALAEDTLPGKKKKGEEEKEDKAAICLGFFSSSLSVPLFGCSMLVLRNKKDRGVVGVNSKAEQKSLEPGLANDLERGLADWLDLDWMEKQGKCRKLPTQSDDHGAGRRSASLAILSFYPVDGWGDNERVRLS